MRHLSLDPLGGVAGDMFVAALLDAFPEYAGETIAAAERLSGAACRLVVHQDLFAGRRFVVSTPEQPHEHVAWREIRARVAGSDLPTGARDHALGIFGLLAEAEAKVHGVAPDQVAFHELGAADSIADIVAAAWLIAKLEPARWSVAPLPLGAGRVRTAHGMMPVPAPATALLLEGFSLVDDGVAGERVTPTGAAILRYLNCGASRPRRAGRLAGAGFGFGSRKLPGMANTLRVLVFEGAGAQTGPAVRELAVIEFEVDDQSAEDLACGLDRLRAHDAVLDVVQWAAFGKKSRMATHVQILARPEALDGVTEACFRETATIGLRTHFVRRTALPRRQEEVVVDGASFRVKLVERPGGMSGKAECDDVLALEGHAARARLRRRAEELAEARALGETDDA